MFTTIWVSERCLSLYAFNDTASRDGIRSENDTRGCGSRAIDENEDNVAPWNGCVRPGGIQSGDALCLSSMSRMDVTTATG